MENVQTFKIHQRLNAQHQQFHEWLIGFTEGDGCFSLNKQKTSWIIGLKIAVGKSDIKTLIFIKKNLRCGSISWANKEQTMVQFRIQNLKHLFNYVFPVFDAYPMVTNKGQDYSIIREAAEILYKNSKEKKEKIQELAFKLKKIRQNRQALTSSLETRVKSRNPQIYCEELGISIDWIQQRYLLDDFMAKGLEGFQELSYRVSKDLSFYWSMGFFQAEGSFYVVVKDQSKKRFCCGFGISQKTPFILEVLRKKWHIPSKVKERIPQKSRRIFYQLDNTNTRVNEHIKKLCFKLLGIKSLQYRIWSRHLNSDDIQLEKVQLLLRNLTKNK